LVKSGVKTPPAKSLRLFYSHPFEHDALRIGTIAGLVGWPPTVRTGKAHDVTLALGDGIGEPLEKTLRLLRLTAEITRRRGGCCTRRSADRNYDRRLNQQVCSAHWLHHLLAEFQSELMVRSTGEQKIQLARSEGFEPPTPRFVVAPAQNEMDLYVTTRRILSLLENSIHLVL